MVFVHDFTSCDLSDNSSNTKNRSHLDQTVNPPNCPCVIFWMELSMILRALVEGSRGFVMGDHPHGAIP